MQWVISSYRRERTSSNLHNIYITVCYNRTRSFLYGKLHKSLYRAGSSASTSVLPQWRVALIPDKKLTVHSADVWRLVTYLMMKIVQLAWLHSYNSAILQVSDSIDTGTPGHLLPARCLLLNNQSSCLAKEHFPVRLCNVLVSWEWILLNTACFTHQQCTTQVTWAQFGNTLC